MTAEQVLDELATMPQEEWVKVQAGIADMLAARFSSTEVAEIQGALAEAEAEINRGESLSGEAMRQHFGLR